MVIRVPPPCKVNYLNLSGMSDLWSDAHDENTRDQIKMLSHHIHHKLCLKSINCATSKSTISFSVSQLVWKAQVVDELAGLADRRVRAGFCVVLFSFNLFVYYFARYQYPQFQWQWNNINKQIWTLLRLLAAFRPAPKPKPTDQLQ